MKNPIMRTLGYRFALCFAKNNSEVCGYVPLERTSAHRIFHSAKLGRTGLTQNRCAYLLLPSQVKIPLKVSQRTEE